MLLQKQQIHEKTDKIIKTKQALTEASSSWTHDM